MKKIALLLGIWLVSASIFAQNTPLNVNGRLKLVGRQLSNEYGNPVQLRGMSSHGLQWFGNCINASSMDALAYQWGCDIVRAAMYVQEGGYVTNPAGFRAKVDEMVDMAAARGMYCMIDWHMLTPGNPWANINEAKEFFRIMAQKHAGKKHVLYEICNEPNGIDWLSIKGYAEQIIPIIRSYDSEAIIIVGTPTWSGEPHFAADNPITGGYAYNLMYTYHFYAGTHYAQNYINGVLSRIPIFVTEWGTSNASGNGGNDYTNAQRWIDLFAGQNSSGIKVSWCNWSFCDKAESSAALNPGACGGGQWNNTSTSGTWVKDHILFPADDFRGGSTGTQSPYYGSPFTLPANIQAEDYDKGGAAVAFQDSDALNNGGAYRTDAVDIETSTEGGYNVGWLAAGEWLEYSVNVPSSGSYTIDTRVASNRTGGNFHIEFNGVNTTGAMAVANTSGWQNWTTVSKTVNLTSGNQIMRFVVDAAGFNINNFNIKSNAADLGIVNGAIYKFSARHSGKCLDVNAFSTANGAKIQQWDCAASQTNQSWKVESTGDGFYKITAQNSGKALDVANFSTVNGGIVHQWDYVGGDNQKWTIVDLANGFYRITNKLSGKSLDVAEVSTANGAQIQQWTYGGGNNQQWRIERINALRLGNGILEDNAVATSLTIAPNPSENGIFQLSIPPHAGSLLKVQVINSMGLEVLRSQYTTHEFTVELPGSASGVYQVIVRDELGNSWNEKLVR